ncbi:hypothetical protein GO986_12700 [Deinococcus sp. HMF7620]|uniref:Uncharacterized protein n=1 Tax=Deinococcus arboris TaxID=2682977 RepID=A0A7C9IBU3_9DEIO|nr:hypothetical protein [Deinococcus arboris]MVN87626.1 hypothetical protein [Deinococcus arboris]
MVFRLPFAEAFGLQTMWRDDTPYALNVLLFGKVLLTLLILMAGLITLYMMAYAFSVPRSVLVVLQVTVVVFSVLAAGLVWKLSAAWLVPALLAVAVLTFILLQQGGGL